MSYVNAITAVLMFSFAWTSGEGNQEKKGPPSPAPPPSATVDFRPVNAIQKGKGRIRLVVTAADGTIYDNTLTVPFGERNDADVFAVTFAASMQATGKDIALDMGWDCKFLGPFVNITAWNAGKGRKVPIKGIRIISPDGSVQPVNMPIITVRGGVKVDQPNGK